jgi:multidrug resistance protein, MATE family
MFLLTHNKLGALVKEKWLNLLKMAWPLIVANSFWNLQLTIDRVYLGNFSIEALGAAMAVMGVFWVPMALLQQTASYLMTFVAQYFGAKEQHKIGPAVWQALYVSLAGGVLFLGLIPLSPMLFRWIGHSSNLIPLEIEYFDSVCYSALPAAIVAACSAFFSGLGRTRVVIGINAVGLVTNVIFDYLLIFGNLGFPAWGVAGAGYATTLANFASAFYGLSLVFQKNNSTQFNLRSGWQLDLDLMKRFLKFGIPSGLQWALEGLAFTVFLILIGRMQYGDAALASSSIAITVMMLSILPTMGVAQAVSVKVGQFLGGKKPHLAEEASWTGLQISATYIVMVSSTLVLFPDFYLSWFKNNQNAELWGQVQTMTPYILMYVALFTCFDSMNLVFSFALKGAGDTRFVTLVALLIPWPIMVLPTWYMQDWENSVYWAWGAASAFIIMQAFIFLGRFRGGKWKSMSVIH